MASKLELLKNAKIFLSLPEELRWAAKYYNWIKFDCATSKNFETWDETLVFRAWMVQTFQSMGISMSVIPMPTRKNLMATWFEITNHLQTDSLKEMEDTFFSIKKRYNGFVAVSDESEAKRLEEKRIREENRKLGVARVNNEI